MSDQKADQELRAQKRVAKKYRDLGYHVIENPFPDSLPSFLAKIRPDLVATSATEKVVIEIKRSNALKGANDILELASVISNQPGWRFELVVLEPDREKILPASADERLNSLIVKSELASGARLYDMAYIYLAAILEEMVRDIGEQNGIRASDKGMGHIARELVYKGVLDQEIFEKVGRVAQERNRIVHAPPSDVQLSMEDVSEINLLCQDIRKMLMFQPA